MTFTQSMECLEAVYRCANSSEQLLRLKKGDTMEITTLDRLGRSTQNMLVLAETLRGGGAELRVLKLGGGNVDTHTPMEWMAFTVIVALTQMELETNRSHGPSLETASVDVVLIVCSRFLPPCR